MTNHKITITTIIVFSVLLFLSSCDSKQNEVQNEPEGPAVETAVAQMTPVPKSYQFTGSVQGEQRINLSTKIMGRITELPYDLGDEVSKGEVLLRIKNDNIIAQRDQVEANLAQAKTTLKNTRTNYERIKALYADSSATQKELDDITTHFEVAKAQVKALKSKLAEIKDMMDYSVIESPIDGYIVQKNVSQGDLASPGRPLLVLEEVNNLKILVSVPSSQIGLFSKGDSLNISIDAAKANFRGIVKSVNPSGDAMSRQFEVKVAIPKDVASQQEVKPGMFARLSLDKGDESVISVPETALVEHGQLTGIYTLGANEQVLLRWVRTGRKIGSNVVILSGLSKGDRYIASYDGRLHEGQKVTIQ